jgi:hypothetical protein
MTLSTGWASWVGQPGIAKMFWRFLWDFCVIVWDFHAKNQQIGLALPMISDLFPCPPQRSVCVSEEMQQKMNHAQGLGMRWFFGCV